MATRLSVKPAVNLMFSHMGLSIIDIDIMERFYTQVLGFTVTDRGEIPGPMKLVFLSRDPMKHHEIVLATGRPENMAQNTVNPFFGPSINQISFNMGSLADLRDIKERLEDWGITEMMIANHGIAWSIYTHDPEGNTLEFYIDSDWYIVQPFLVPLDFSKTDDEIYQETKAMCEASPGFEPIGAWRDRVAKRMSFFMPPKFKE